MLGNKKYIEVDSGKTVKEALQKIDDKIIKKR